MPKFKGNKEKFLAIKSGVPPVFIFPNDDGKNKVSSEEALKNKASALGFAVINKGKIDSVGVEGTLIPGNSQSPHVTTKSLFDTASLAKPVTAYGAIRCLSANGIDIDTPIDEFLPPVPTSYPFPEDAISEKTITGARAAQYIKQLKKEPAEALELITQFRAWAKKEELSIDMQDIDSLEQEILKKNEFLYGTLATRNLLQKFTGQGITFRELLEHSSGIRDKPFPKGDAEYESSTEFSHEWLKGATVDRTLPANKRTWSYSNAGYTIVECALESIMKKPYPEIMQQFVFKPLSMQNSTFSQSTDRLDAKERVQGQLWNGQALPHLNASRGSGGMHTTPEDYAKFANELMKVHRKKENDPVKEMFKKQKRKLDSGHDCNYGLGIGVSGSGKDLVFSHGGGLITVCNDVIMYPNRNQAAVVMINGGLPGSYTRRILNSIGTVYKWDGIEDNTIALSSIQSHQQQRYIGEYQMPELMANIKVKIVKGMGQDLMIEMPWPEPNSPAKRMKLYQDESGNLYAPEIMLKVEHSKRNKTIEFVFFDKRVGPPSPLLSKPVKPIPSKYTPMYKNKKRTLSDNVVVKKKPAKLSGKKDPKPPPKKHGM